MGRQKVSLGLYGLQKKKLCRKQAKQMFSENIGSKRVVSQGSILGIIISWEIFWKVSDLIGI